MALDNHIFIGYYTYTTPKKDKIKQYLDEVQNYALEQGARKAIWLEQDQLVTTEKAQTVCDFDQVDNSKDVLLGVVPCTAFKTQTRFEDAYQQTFSLWRKQPVDHEVIKKNKQLLAHIDKGDLAASVASIESGAQIQVAIDLFIGMHDELLISSLLQRTGAEYGLSRAVKEGYPPVLNTFIEYGDKPTNDDRSHALSRSNHRLARTVSHAIKYCPTFDFV